MTATTTDLSAAGQEVWVQKEGHDPMCLFCEPHTKIIEDLKQLVLGDQRDKYQTFYRGQYLRPGGFIPTDTNDKELIQLKRINNRRCKCFFSAVSASQSLIHFYSIMFLFSAIHSNDDNDDTGMITPLPAYDERRARIMHDNRKMAPKWNKCINRLQSNCT
jgi:hypothetical protein